MRGTYGRDLIYTEMAVRALQLWPKYEKRWKRQFLHRTGVLWMASSRDDTYEIESIEALRKAKIRFRELSSTQMKKRWPQINFEGIEWGIYEPECGYLDARASCQAVVEAFVAAGGRYRPAAVIGDLDGSSESDNVAPAPRQTVAPASRRLSRERPRSRPSHSVHTLELTDGSRLKADYYVFACGPWLGRLFPATIGDLIQPTKQDVFFFGPPAGDDRFSETRLPVWADHLERFRYGIPGSGRRGFKIADDTRGPGFDPTNGERVVNQETLRDIRQYVAFRFPALKDAPLLETRVCQYEQTPDSHFIVDRHPASENVWIVGGGSGHGFKHGPAIGEMMAELILKNGEPDATWRLARFQNLPRSSASLSS
jgi:sarcosine oxidase